HRRDARLPVFARSGQQPRYGRRPAGLGGEPGVLDSQEGRLVLKTGTAQGFTLVELMVGLTIIGIVIAMGMPGFTTYLQGSKLANSAYSYLSGIQLARAEAIRRNVPVQFILTADPI